MEFSRQLNEKLNRLREEVTAGTQDEKGQMRLTLLQVLLLILAGSLSGAAKEAEKQAA
jgi:hypothetical protein